MNARYLSNKLADLHMVVHASGTNKAELKWAAIEALRLAGQMSDRLKLAGPLLDAVEAIAYASNPIAEESER